MLLLTIGTVVSAAPADDYPRYGATTRTGRLFLMGNLEVVLLHARLTGGAVIVLDTRPFTGYALGQDCPDGFVDTLDFLGIQARCRTQGTYSGGVEYLVGVHIANAGDDGLVNEDRFDRGRLFFKALRQNLRREIWGKWLGAEFAKDVAKVFREPYPGERSWITEEDLIAIIETKMAFM